MQALPIMMTLWALSATAFTGLMVYRGHLTRHETDQLFLTEAEDQSEVHREHDEIVRRVDRITPFCQGFGGAAALLTIAIVGVFVAQALPNVQL